jgi:hypothetical protein
MIEAGSQIDAWLPIYDDLFSKNSEENFDVLAPVWFMEQFSNRNSLVGIIA